MPPDDGDRSTAVTESDVDRAETRLREYQDGIPHLSWTVDIHGGIDFCNARWYEYTGRDPDGLLGHRWLEIVHPDDRPKHLAEWQRCMESGDPYEEDLRLRRHDGEWRWHAVRDWPARDRDGTVIRWYGTATDVHDRHIAERALRDAYQELEQFAAIASHDLQEPLRMVINYLGLIQRRSRAKFDHEDARYFTEAIDGATRMQHLIRLLLDYAKIGRSDLKLERIDPRATVTEALHILRPRVVATGGR
jgi:PAS domain S-box-containing protein